MAIDLRPDEQIVDDVVGIGWGQPARQEGGWHISP
jgi:hypothetical protein